MSFRMTTMTVQYSTYKRWENDRNARREECPAWLSQCRSRESFHANAINGFQTNAFKPMKKRVSNKLHFGHCMRSSIFQLRRLWHKLCYSFAMWVHYAGIRNGITNYNSIESVLFVLCNSKILPYDFHYVVVIATVDVARRAPQSP